MQKEGGGSSALFNGSYSFDSFSILYFKLDYSLNINYLLLNTPRQ